MDRSGLCLSASLSCRSLTRYSGRRRPRRSDGGTNELVDSALLQNGGSDGAAQKQRHGDPESLQRRVCCSRCCVRCTAHSVCRGPATGCSVLGSAAGCLFIGIVCFIEISVLHILSTI